MNIINKFTLANLNKNKKRTIVTAIGIALSTALICAVAGMVMSFQNTVVEYAKNENGDYHICYEEIPISQLKYIQNNINIESYFLSKPLGYAKLEGSKNKDKPYVFITACNEKSLKNNGFVLTKGRMPENENEIVISKHIEYNARVYWNVGDTITLDVGTRKNQEGYILKQSNPYNMREDVLVKTSETDEFKEEIVNTKKKTYKIVGIIERPSYQFEDYSAPGYTLITYMTDEQILSYIDANEENEDYNIANISVTFKKPNKYEEVDKEINRVLFENTGKKYNQTKNMALLEYQGALKSTSLNALYSLRSNNNRNNNSK